MCILFICVCRTFKVSCVNHTVRDWDAKSVVPIVVRLSFNVDRRIN